MMTKAISPIDDAGASRPYAADEQRIPASRSGRVAGLFWTSLTVAIFAGWFVVTRFSVTRQLTIWDLTVLRFGIGAVLLSPAVLRRGTRPSLATWRKGLLFMALWGVPFVLLMALGVRLTSAVQAASITPPLMPVFAGLFATIFLGERLGRLRPFGYAAIVAGIALLVYSGTPGGAHPNLIGLGALAAAAALWAAYTLIFRMSGVTPLQSAAMICVWSTAFALPIYLVSGVSHFHLASVQEIAFQAFYQGVLMSAVALVTYSRGVSLLGTSAAAAVIAFLPAVASLLAIPVLGEVPGAFEVLAIAVIVGGALIAARPVPVATNTATR